MPQATRDQLRQRFLDSYGELVPPAPRGKSDETRRPRRPYVRADERAIGYVPYAKGELPDPLPATLVAFYLPQFHTIPENDEWWGKGFTEWRNVTRALPQFEGHYQPKLPSDLGFYDLRNVEVMHEQARLAREYGISAFCFYFYWFGGKTLLETPLRNWLNDKSIDLKFCLCWANEKWTRTWDGRGEEVLIDQEHDAEDDLNFIAYVAEYMRDSRYLKVDGKPVLLVYRPSLLPSMKETGDRWRKWCRSNGLGEIHLAYVQSFERPNPRVIGCDAAVEFPPNLSTQDAITQDTFLLNPEYRGQVLDWREMRAQFSRQEHPYETHRGVNCGWDNQPRRPSAGRSYLYSSPSGYREWLRDAIHRSPSSKSQPLIFINAWNEWAEGAVLEPQSLLGHAYLSATRHAIQLASQPTSTQPAPLSLVVIVHAWHLDAFEEIVETLTGTGLNWRLVVTTTQDKYQKVSASLKNCDLVSEVHIFDNRGRDILPFLRVAKVLYEEGVDFLLKLHTKRSLHRNDGDEWRRDLISKLIEENRAALIARAFEEDEALGLVAPEGHLQSLAYYWGANQKNVEYISKLIGIPELCHEDNQFASGSMFWIRLSAIESLLDSTLTESDFENERGQVDGTFAHAVERLFAICTITQGLSLTDAATICDQTPRGTISPYAYATRHTQ